MFRVLALVALGACLVPYSCLQAQVTATAPETEAPQYTQRWDLYGGAQYSHFNPSPGAEVRAINLVGWNATATAWFRPLIGMEASVRGLNGNLILPPNNLGIPLNPPMSEHLVLFGPNFRMLRRPQYALGMHALIGAAYGAFGNGFPKGTTPQMLEIYNDKLAMGMAFGGYADYNLTRKFSVRFISDWQPTHYGYTWQSEYAGSIGIVYKMGSLHIR